MKQSDSAYFARRAEEQRRMGERTRDSRAAAIHRELAEAYRQRAVLAETDGTGRVASQ